MQADVVIKNGTVVDGSGGPSRQADVAIAGGKIVAVGEVPATDAARVIDATDLKILPGFIDIHTHSDVSLILDPRCQSKILQGVTTEVTGNCSFAPFPFAPDKMELHADHLHRIGDGVPPLTWNDVDGYVATVETNPPAFNVAPLAGHGTLRVAAMGVDQREATPDELATMKRLLAECLEQGAFGMSTGLTHVPSAYGPEEEVTELVKVVAQYDALYATHQRGAKGRVFGGMEESIRTATAAGARLQASHAAINNPDHWGKAVEMLALVDEARDNGLDIAIDVYPYDASSSSLTQYLPQWVQDGGTEAMRARLADPAALERAEQELAAGWFGGIPWFWDRVLMTRTGAGDEWCVGLTIEQAAAKAGMTPAAFTLKTCLDHGNYPGVVLFYRTEDDMMTFLAHHTAVVGSDGSALPLDQGANKPHPRSFGTFPRIFGRYVRDKGLLTWEEAAVKTSSGVAERLQLADRGQIAEGLVADIVIMDPATVIDRSTFTDPAQSPTGIPYVIVNGAIAVDEGEQTEARSGRVLRRTR
ncbi:MAG: D-aminoacylase [Nitriliruptoraceae bacterium]